MGDAVTPPFSSNSFNEMEETDLLQLINDGIQEGLHLEYKSELEKDPKEFAKDLSAFANGHGGYLIYGIEEEKHHKTPTGLRAAVLPGENLEAALSRLHNWAISHIRPIPHFRKKGIALTSGGYVLVLDIPKSWSSPHEVIQDHRYYLRSQNGKDPMNVDQLREAFGFSASAMEQAELFRMRRLTIFKQEIQIQSGFATSPALVTHLIPLGFSNPANRLSLEKPQPAWVSPYSTGCAARYNLEGVHLQYSMLSTNWHVQLNRNGIMEYCHVAGREQGGAKNISATAQINQLAGVVRNMKSYIKLWNIPGPFLLASSLVNCKNWDLFCYTGASSGDRVGTLDRNEIVIPEIYLESIEADEYELIQPIADALWNSAGEERCFDYDENGKWLGRS